ncbi:CDP-glucose 4,6-dehydratase [compost metagenome]
MISQGFWQDRKVFILGHTGFRGSHLAQVLQGLGAVVSGLGLLPKTNPSFFEIENLAQGMASTIGDARDFSLLKSQIEFNQPEIIFSFLGGSGLKASKEDPRETYEVQMMGTVNLLEAVRSVDCVRGVVFLTSDKVYRRDLSVAGYSEEAALGGSSPAATAKACVELIVESYQQSFFQPDKYNKHKVSIATARMGSVVGTGDFDSESLVWQAIQAIRAETAFTLRNPESVRDWLGMKDAVSAFLTLGEALISKGPKASGAWNFAPRPENRVPVREFMEFLGLASNAPLEGAKPSVHGEILGTKTFEQLGWKAEETLSDITTDVLSWYQKKGFLT